jgi:hypothetical protein
LFFLRASIDGAVRHYLIDVVDGTFGITGKNKTTPSLKALVE